MSTGLSGAQLDALRAEIYAEAVAVGHQLDQRASEFHDLVQQGACRSRLDDQGALVKESAGKPEGLYRALFLLDSARREAAQSKVGSKR